VLVGAFCEGPSRRQYLAFSPSEADATRLSGGRRPLRQFYDKDRLSRFKQEARSASALRVRVTPDGKSYAYTYERELSDLYIGEGLR